MNNVKKEKINKKHIAGIVKSKKKDILLIVCVCLSIFLICMGIVDFFIPCTGWYCLRKPLIILILPVFLTCIWAFYCCAVIVKYLYKKNKILSILFIALILVLVYINIILMVNN